MNQTMKPSSSPSLNPSLSPSSGDAEPTSPPGVLNGLMAVITGGTGGIGRASAEALLAAGAAGVLINGRDPVRAEAARADIQAPQRRIRL